ncbi:DNA-binding transcriptional regulator, AcrR family [Parafrankia irregularis]|uniref:DNA-binding transcriptional regulator, AcrR family n=1 Tax=Parafrankia irregularis TaxID=795642 RepID=A0A0S4QHQ3_9ACTN|nr:MULTISPECIES: TetR/AcrR family transcriptional regulator [Parafrankia]MBE3200915.1 helix-turn-helix transcriptional regulator [Parafrankia sp. CH37]CUU54687.1 DNA-binding transcriptional regulator, AcrR family [Parafrankia irregularis]
MTGPERADAARNRAAILAAAAELFDRDGVEEVSMNDIARHAGVGKGTIFRRFGDRTALIEAVLLPRAAAMRRLVHHGPPPVGPGGEPLEALHALLDTLFDFVWANRTLIRALEHRVPHSYYAHSSSRYWLDELARRLTITHPHDDTEYLTHILSTALRADVVDYLVSVRGMALDQVRTGLHRLAFPSVAPPSLADVDRRSVS